MLSVQVFRALPVQRLCEVSQAIEILDRREAYRQAILIVERGVARVPTCVECVEARSRPRAALYFGGCFTAGAGKCAECLRNSQRKCSLAGGAGGPALGKFPVG